jgi:hypothetical protein
MIRFAALFVVAGHLCAHMMSMSTGDATVSGNHVEYILRMPLYEIPHTEHPEKALFQHIRFASGGHAARTVNQECHADPAHDTYLCAAYYEFPEAVEHLDVDCTFYEVTVRNHVHLLRAEKNGKQDQAIFDYTFTHASILFRPPTAFETAVRQSGAGALRSVGGAIQILFLISLALAARSRRELAVLALMFVAGQIAGALMHWRPPARFVESAAALTVAYLAVEILFLPEAGLRWLIAGCLGVFHGLYFALFIQDSGYRAAWVLGGAAVVEICVVAVAGVLLARVPRKIPAGVLLAVGLAWFFVRLRG